MSLPTVDPPVVPCVQAWTKLFPRVMKPGGRVRLAATDVQGEGGSGGTHSGYRPDRECSGMLQHKGLSANVGIGEGEALSRGGVE